MFKILAFITLIFIVNSLWAASLSCDACGRECSSACGTRRFRTCCFNYLRKKRGPEAIKFYIPTQHLKENAPRAKYPLFVEETIALPEQWIASISNDSRALAADILENHYYDS